MTGIVNPLEQYKWIAWAIVAVAIFGCGCATGFGLRGNIANAAESKLREEHALAVKAISDTAAQAAEDALAIQKLLENKIAAIDAARTEENERAKAKFDNLIADIRTVNRRLSVAASCPAGSGGVSKPASGSGVGDGAQRAELDPAAAERILRVAGDGDQAIRQLSACQDYVRAIISQGGK